MAMFLRCLFLIIVAVSKVQSLAINQNILICDFKCPGNGLFSHPTDLSKFCHCSGGIPYQKDCPLGLHFDPKEMTCLHPVEAQCGTDNEDYKVVCYYNYWSNYYSSDGKFQVENIDPCLCTHLVYAYVDINSCYDVLILDPHLQGGKKYRGREDFRRFINLKKKNPKLKVLVAFGGYNGDHFRFLRMISNEKHREDFISNLERFMREYCVDKDCFDGVSLDYYYPSSERPPDNMDIKSLLVKIREMFKMFFAGKNMTIAVSASGLGTDIKEYYDIHNIAELADFVSLVTYDYHGPTWSNNRTGMIAPLFERKLVNGGQDNLNQNATVYTWLNRRIAQVDPRKLLLGMPTYGRAFILANSSMTELGAPTTGAANIGPYTNNPGYFTHNELVNNIFKNGKWNYRRDGEQEVPYAYKGNHWISYEDEKSFERKANYIKANNLGGAVINSIDSDNFIANSYPLIRAVKEVLLGNRVPTTTTTTPTTTTTAAVTTTSPTTTSTAAVTTTSPTTTAPGFFKCVKTGLFTNTLNCTKFYECNRQPDGSFKQFDRVCPELLGFDESTCRCNWFYDVLACFNPDAFDSNGCIPEEWTDFIP